MENLFLSWQLLCWKVDRMGRFIPSSRIETFADNYNLGVFQIIIYGIIVFFQIFLFSTLMMRNVNLLW